MAGAVPGDILQVDVLSADPWADWGWNVLRRGKGALGATAEFKDRPDETVVIPIDLERRVALPPW